MTKEIIISLLTSENIDDAILGVKLYNSSNMQIDNWDEIFKNMTVGCARGGSVNNRYFEIAVEPKYPNPDFWNFEEQWYIIWTNKQL